jgi:hypothetical protein
MHCIIPAAAMRHGTIVRLFVLEHPDGHVVVWQRMHAGMCAQVARAWGSDAFRDELHPDEAQLERNRRLVRYWDGLSHDLLARRWPRVRHGVPAADGDVRDIELRAAGERLTLDPWPFANGREHFAVTGRLLQDRYETDAELQAAFDSADEVELAFTLEAA